VGEVDKVQAANEFQSSLRQQPFTLAVAEDGSVALSFLNISLTAG